MTGGLIFTQEHSAMERDEAGCFCYQSRVFESTGCWARGVLNACGNWCSTLGVLNTRWNAMSPLALVLNTCVLTTRGHARSKHNARRTRGERDRQHATRGLIALQMHLKTRVLPMREHARRHNAMERDEAGCFCC